MTEIRQPMHRLTLQLLIGSVLISLTSMAGALVLLWPDERAPSEPARSAPAVSAMVHLAPEQAVRRLPSPPKAQKSSKTAPETPFPKVKAGAQKRDVQNFRGTPSVMPDADEDTIQLLPFGDEVYVLFNEKKLSRQQRRRALVRLMLLPQAPTAAALLSEQGVPLLKRPFYFGRILDERGQPVRYPLQAARLADRLLSRADREDGWETVRIPLRGVDWTARAQRWREAVTREAGAQAPLVLALMEVESGFRPDAVSRSGAVGLMQIKPDAAGRDVAAVLRRTLDHRRLLEPTLNLQAGIAYLNLLQRRYLTGVSSPLSREYLTIAAYNGGIGAVLRQFGRTPQAAIERINRLRPEQVYRILRHQFPRRETRLYLEKVTQAKARYSAWMANNV